MDSLIKDFESIEIDSEVHDDVSEILNEFNPSTSTFITFFIDNIPIVPLYSLSKIVESGKVIINGTFNSIKDCYNIFNHCIDKSIPPDSSATPQDYVDTVETLEDYYKSNNYKAKNACYFSGQNYQYFYKITGYFLNNNLTISKNETDIIRKLATDKSLTITQRNLYELFLLSIRNKTDVFIYLLSAGRYQKIFDTISEVDWKMIKSLETQPDSPYFQEFKNMDMEKYYQRYILSSDIDEIIYGDKKSDNQLIHRFNEIIDLYRALNFRADLFFFPEMLPVIMEYENELIRYTLVKLVYLLTKGSWKYFTYDKNALDSLMEFVASYKENNSYGNEDYAELLDVINDYILKKKIWTWKNRKNQDILTLAILNKHVELVELLINSLNFGPQRYHYDLMRKIEREDKNTKFKFKSPQQKVYPTEPRKEWTKNKGDVYGLGFNRNTKSPVTYNKLPDISKTFIKSSESLGY